MHITYPGILYVNTTQLLDGLYKKAFLNELKEKRLNRKKLSELLIHPIELG